MPGGGGGKIRLKRRQICSKPYHRQVTTFGKLKNSVKELLTPSWWPGTQSQQECQDDVQAELEHLSPASEDCGRDETSILDLTSPNKDIEQQDAFELSHIWRRSQLLQESPRVLHHKPFDSERAYFSDSYIDDDDEDTDAEMTLAWPIKVSSATVQSSFVSQSHVGERKLWRSESDREGKPLVAPVREKPAFNSALLGCSNLSACGDSCRDSMYHGRTAGSMAQGKWTSQHQQPLILRRQVKLHKLTNSFHAVTSTRAQRILQMLETAPTQSAAAPPGKAHESHHHKSDLAKRQEITLMTENTGANRTQSSHMSQFPAVRKPNTASGIFPLSLHSKPLKCKQVTVTNTFSLNRSYTFSWPIEVKRQPSQRDMMIPEPRESFRFSSPINAFHTKMITAGAEGGNTFFHEPIVGASSMLSTDDGGISSEFRSLKKWSCFGKQSTATSGSSSHSPTAGFFLSHSACQRAGAPAAAGTASDPPGCRRADFAGGMLRSKKPVQTWECDICMLVNNTDFHRCMACGSPKPRDKQADVNYSAHAVSRKMSSNWECGTCMTQNTAGAFLCSPSKPGLSGVSSVSVTESSSPTSELSSSGYQNEAVDLSIDGGDKLHGAEVIGQVSPSSESGLHAEDIVSSRSSNETSNTWACDGTVQSVSWSMSDAVSADISKADHAAGDVCSDHVFSPDSASASDGSPQLGLASIFKPSQKHTSCGLTQVTSIPALFTWWHPISDMSAVKPSLVTCDCVTTNSGGMCTRKDESNFHPSLGDGDVHMVTCATNGENTNMKPRTDEVFHFGANRSDDASNYVYTDAAPSFISNTNLQPPYAVPFQLCARPVPADLFKFDQASTAASLGWGFPPRSERIGSFNIGTTDPNRIIKKAVRKLKRQ